MSKKYIELKEDLESVLRKLQDEAIDIEEAIVLHKQAEKLLLEMEKRLNKTYSELEAIKIKRK